MKKYNQYNSMIINKYWILIITILAGSVLFIFNDLGLLKWYSLKNNKNNMENAIKKLIEKELTIKNKIDAIKTNDKYLEKIAREQFQMVKPGEKIFRVINKRDVKK